MKLNYKYYYYELEKLLIEPLGIETQLNLIIGISIKLLIEPLGIETDVWANRKKRWQQLLIEPLGIETY